MAEKEREFLRGGVALRNRYVIEKVLGKGGFGVTYQAYDRVEKMEVAIKECLSEKGDSKSLEKEFLEEARRLAQFNPYPGIVDVYEFFRENGRVYMVMELLEGMSLLKIVKNKQNPLKEEEILKLMQPVMQSLDIVHRKGWIHCDISPDNMMINKKGYISLIDFGIARSMTKEEKVDRILLKKSYAPLEQYDYQGNLGPWTDVYALGATIYYMASKAKLPSARDRAQRDTHLPLHQMNHKISKHFSATIEKALSIDYRTRYQTMGDFLYDLTFGNKKSLFLKKDILRVFRKKK